MQPVMLLPRVEYLGARRNARGAPPNVKQVTYHVYAVWLDPARDLLQSICSMAARAFACPECGTPWPLTRDGGMAMQLSKQDIHTVRGGSDSCPTCPTLLHFDRSTLAEQRALKWPYEFDRKLEGVSDRAMFNGGSRWLGTAEWGTE